MAVMLDWAPKSQNNTSGVHIFVLAQMATKENDPQNSIFRNAVTENANMAEQWTIKPGGIGLDSGHQSSAEVQLQAQKDFTKCVWFEFINK